MKKAILLPILILFPFLLSAQTYNMSNNFVTNNSGTIYDSGGPNGNYGNNQNFVFTICPSNSPSCWGLAFSQFDLENTYDFLYIYEGSSTSSPLIGTYTDNNSPGVVQATGNCLTLQFTSDFIVTNPGFSAIWGECPDANVEVPVCPDANIAPLEPVCPNTCVDLEVEIVETANTTSYVVENIPYDPLPFNVGIVQNVPVDDTWSNVVNINFNFCFYGNTYNQIVVGTNGLISFNTAYANQYCQWPINDPFPSNNNPINSIGAPYHDIDPAVSGIMRYGTYGEAPCRAFIITWQNVPMYSSTCNNLLATQQIILYETSNIIDTYIENKPLCPSWNGGAAIHGIQNANGTQATVVPGRNYPAQWTTANDGKRFRPNGTPTYNLTWYENGTTPIGNSETITVCPDEETTYMAEAIYTNCDGSTIIANDTIDVIINQAFEVTATQNDVSCSTGNNGSITVTPTGGSGNYSYNWSNFQTTPTINNLGAGSYSITITDNLTPDCPFIETYTIELAPPITANIVSTDAICDGATGSSIDLTVSGGTMPYTYNWSGGLPNQQDHNDIASGNYTVTVSDDNGCTAVVSTTVNVSPGLTINLTANDADCGLSNGSLNLSINGGTPFFTYDWNDNTLDGTQNPMNIPSGTYSVTVTDINGCSDNASVTINDNSPPTVSMMSTDANCGLPDGSAMATAANGTPPYTYLWNTTPPQTTPNADNLTAGSYTITVSDANDCTVVGNVTISDTPSPTVLATSTPANCGLSDGSATAAATNGTPPYLFSWNTTPPQNTATANNLATGSYSVTLTDNIGCTAETTVTIGENPPPTATTDVLDANCGQADGGANVTASGGTPPYTYLWNTTPPATTLGVGSLAAGTYSVTVTDANGCTVEASATVGDNPLPTISATATDATCGDSNGSATATASGGTPPYSYEWNTTPPQTTATASNLMEGNYTVIVTDNVGCIVSDNISISNSEPPTISATSTDATCGDSNGSATASASGGTPPYSFSWASPINSNNATVNTLPEGNYSVVVSDSNGCTAETNVTIGNSPPLNGTIDTEDANCEQNDGSATVNANGGTPPYSYTWSSSISSNSATANDLLAGNYSVTVADNIGCTVIVPITINDIPGPTANTDAIDATCGEDNGQVSVTVSGGSTPYTYIWSTTPPQTTNVVSNVGVGNYTVTITDANNCTLVENVALIDVGSPTATITPTNAACNEANGSITINAADGLPPYTYAWNTTPPQTTTTINNLDAGDYSVTVTDANGCNFVTQASITNTPAVEADISSENANCGQADGSASVSVTNGTPPYTYSWNDTASQNGTTANDLVTGDYTVIITDAIGCTLSLNVNVGDNPPPTVSATFENPTCELPNGSAEATGTGGQGAYTYLWNTTPPQNTAIATNLLAGIYSVTITDEVGCTASTSVTLTDAGIPTATVTPQNATCGDANGQASATANAGTPPYTYLWSDTNASTTTTITNLAPNTYIVTVTDALGCTNTAETNVIDNSAPTSEISGTDPTCELENGNATVTVLGGLPPYNYLWNDANAQTTATANNLAFGTYTVTVTDGNGCVVINSITLNESELPSVVLNNTDASCDLPNGEIFAEVSGGTPPYTYLWNDANAQITATANNLAFGTYSLTITDDIGCTISVETTLSGTTAPSVNTDFVTATCSEANGIATALATGGQPPYLFTWSSIPVQNTENATDLAEGIYSVTITDANNCTASQTVEIPNIPAPTADITPQNANCGEPNGQATVNVNGNTAPYTYEWNTTPTQTTQTATNLLAGNYEVTVTDVNNCNTIVTIDIIDTGSPSIEELVGTDPICDESNGSATVSISGGTPPYTYEWLTNPIQTNPTATNLGAGTFTINVTDLNGCLVSSSITLTNTPSPTAEATATLSSCAAPDGSATVVASGGTAPYTYEWNTTPPQTTQTAINLGQGSYTATVTDALGCTASAQASVTIPPSPTLETTYTPDECAAGIATATVSVSGGSTPYSYVWNDINTQNTQTATNLTAGIYYVTVTDAAGCSAVENIVIDGTTPPTVDFSTINENCGQANGEAAALPSGGLPPYTYLWNTFPTQGTSTVVGLVAGDYTVTVTDANGCTAVETTTILDEGAPVAEILEFTNPACGVENGEATVSVTGGTPPFNYIWTGPNGFAETTENIQDLASGTYIVTVTDQVSCTASAEVALTAPNAPTVQMSILQTTCGQDNGSATAIVTGGEPPFLYFWSVGGVATDVSTVENIPPGPYTLNLVDGNGCNVASSFIIETSELPSVVLSAENTICGQNNGRVSAVASGGNPPYSYEWNTSPIQFTTDINDLAAGNYSVTTTDANGCSTSENIDVAPSAGPTIDDVTSINSNCNQADGSASVIVSGGTGNITYMWENGDATADISNLLAGSYGVTVSDDLACSTESIAIVSDDGAPTADISGINPTCNEANGSASVVVSGGSGTYTYEWNGDANLNMADLTNVAAGEHTIVITDVNGCIVTASITLTDDGVPTAAIEPQATLCGLNNGSATAIADFGTPPYAYLWSENNQQTENIENLAAGEYFLTITDAIGCTATASAAVESSEELQVVTDGIAATCGLPNGEAAAVPINGQVPHTYLWENGFVTSIATGLFAGDYAVTVTDANLCSASVIVTVSEILPPILSATKTDAICNEANGSISVSVADGTPPFSYIWNDANQQTTAIATNLAAGNYTVTVTDDNDCEVILSESIVNIETPTATLAFTQATCGQSNATVTLTTLSGIPPFSYAWNASTQTTEMITGIAPSLVSVTVTDANNCTFVEQINVTAENSPTATITDFVSPTCGNANGSATVSASGGVPPYSYVWNSSPPQNNLIVNNLAAGNYIVTVTDGNGCIATANIDLVNIAGPTISLSAIDATCQQENGSAIVTVNGGTAPFSYIWNDSNAQTSETATNLASGNYTVTVTDANDCSAVENITIGDSDIPTISISTENASCGQNDGEATASGLGGVSPYSFVWDANANGQTTATASNLFAGAYTVTITDANDCQNTEIANIIDENAPSATTSTTNEICGQQNGTASVSTAGGLPPFTYLWNDTNAQTTEIATNLAAGTYSIEVTDVNGCVATATAIVEETAGATLDISNISATCGENNATASVVANGGLPPYIYLWNDANVQSNATAIDLFSGNYEVTVTDANGCTASISTTISDTDLPIATIITTNSVCGQAVGEATAQAVNGTPSYTYLWNDENAQTGISATGLSAGIYEVTITDAAGCTTSTSATINDEGSPTLTTTSVMPTCNSNNGEASVSVDGNSAPYTYVWNTTPPQTTQTATNLFAGTYVVDVTDVNNCLVSAEIILTNIGGPTLSLSSQNSTCGDANGIATVTTDGIAAPYTYVWSDANAQTTEIATNLLAGTYFVTLTDVNNCETVGEIVVEDIGGPSVSIMPVSASCSLANGEATAIPQNGTAPYTYLWNDANGQTTEIATNLASGDYEVTITDANGCTASATTTILDTPIPTVTAISTNANCGLANGTATATAANGIAPYSYLWDANANNQTTATAIDLFPDTYSVTVTDANSCTAETSVTVGDDGSPTVSLAATNPTCELNNGQAIATAANGLSPYTYLWNDANAQTTATAINLVAGTYTVTVTDANNCTVIDSMTLTDNGNPTAVLSSISATCGDANGSATVVASAGTAPYTYLWNDANGQTTEMAINLAQGNYTVTVTDANGCAAIESILVENIDGPSATTTTLAATCALADGSATVAAIDGTAPYTYLWNDANSQTTETATNLPTGIYEVTVTDANACIFVTEAEVVGFMLAPIITCGESTTSSVTFEWQNVSGAIEYEISIDGNFVETVDASILIYTVTGLSSGQDVEISIVAVGEEVCGSSEATNHICQSLLCPDIPLTINGLDEIYCDYDDNVILVGEPAGGNFSGTGIVGTAFSPSLAGVGTHEINYFYAQDNCQYDTTYVVQVSNVTVSTTPTTTVLETPEAVTIDAIAISGLNGGISYEWSPTESLDCSDCESVVATPIENTAYTVVATDEYGCSANAVSFINFDFNNILVIPNAFSPNGDNENDIFRVKGLNVTEIELYIYNRWGQLVFEDKMTDLAQGWNGKFKDEDCEIGVYVFYAIARFVDGSEEFTKGNVTLIR